MAADVLLLAPLFFTAALLYASVGFGGGSAYLALLSLFGIPIEHIAVIALTGNIIVVAGGSWHWTKAGHLRLSLLVPFLMTSLPAAYFGGRFQVGSQTLQLLTGSALGITALVMLMNVSKRDGRSPADIPRASLWGAGSLLGAGLGGLAGVVGIGGGIFLSPLLHSIGWGRAKQIAATASLFILFNSVAGIIGQVLKRGDVSFLQDYWPLFVAVFVGGQIGSRLGTRRFSPLAVKRLTALVVLAAALRLMFERFA